MARGKAKPDHRADTKGAGFTGLPHVVQDSAAFRDLTLWARAVLFEIVREFHGYNNGEIALSVTQMCERLGNTNRGKAARAVAELMEHGFIDVGADAKWKQRLAREFRLTFISSGKFPAIRPATNDYLKWEPKKTGGNGASPARGPTGNDALPEAGSAGNGALPDRFSTLRKTAISTDAGGSAAGNDASLLISKPSHRPSEGVRTARFDTPRIGGPKSGAAILSFPGATKAGCEKCGEPVVGGGRGKPKRFCSEKCRKSAEAARRYERSKASAG